MYIPISVDRGCVNHKFIMNNYELRYIHLRIEIPLINV